MGRDVEQGYGAATSWVVLGHIRDPGTTTVTFLRQSPSHPSPNLGPRWLTRDGDRGTGLLLQHWVSHQAEVGATGLHQHLEDTLHIKETFLVGHLGRGDVFRDVAALAILPEDASLGVATRSVASHSHEVSWLQVLVGLQVHTGLGVRSCKGEDSQDEAMEKNKAAGSGVNQEAEQALGQTLRR